MAIGLDKWRRTTSEAYFDKASYAASPEEKSFFKNLGTVIYPTDDNIVNLSKDLISQSNYNNAILWLNISKKDESKALLVDLYIQKTEYSKAIQVAKSISDSNLKNYNLAKALYISGDIKTGDGYFSELALSGDVCGLAVLASSGRIKDCTQYFGNNTELLNLIAINDSARIAKFSYNLASSQNYPQLSLAILEKQAELGLADRDVYFELGNRLFGKGDYIGAKQSYLASAEKDGYFPQVYEQLLIVAEKTEDNELRKNSIERLSILRP
jgi:hypothetical protein